MNGSVGLYLVTGGTGFLGHHLITLLLESGAKVRIFARNFDPKYQNNNKVEFFEGSILDQEAVLKASRGVDGIFHLAAVVIHSRLPEHKETVSKSAIVGTLNIMKAAKKAKCRVVYASTSGTIGCSLTPIVHNENSGYATNIVKNWPYYSSKIEAEIKAKKFAKENGIQLILMKPTMMFGPEDDRFRSTHLILSFLNHRIPVVFNGGLSFVDVRDVAKAFKSAMESGKSGDSYLLGAENMTLKNFFELLENISGVPAPKFNPPYPLTYGVVKTIDLVNRKILRKWDPGFDPVKAEMAKHFWYISSEKAKKDLDFNPRPPVDTLKDTIDWIRRNKPNEIHFKAKL